MFVYNNPYIPPQFQPPMQRPPMEQPQFNQFVQQPQFQPQVDNRQGLQGKSVDSIDVVKATDIPLDGSVSYFPLVDGTAIVTKQLQQDGTSKVVVYKPVDKEVKETPKYVTVEDLEQLSKKIDANGTKDIKEDIKTIKRQIRDITDDLKDRKGD